MRIQDRVAIVTGCGRERGIGRAIAMRLAEEGAHVVAVSMAA
jgi:NAD(P)-dependent dehydrogenase (short-subunit alcohol dehydrogenase family)